MLNLIKQRSLTHGRNAHSFLIGAILLTSLFYIPVSPRIYFWHITFTIVAFIPVKNSPKRDAHRGEKFLKWGLFMWLLGSLLSSRVNNLDVRESLILILNPITIAIAISALKKIVFIYEFSIFKLLTFIAMSGCVSEYFIRTPLSSYNLWKYGIGVYVTLALFTYCVYRVEKNITYLIIIVIVSFTSFYFEARSLAAFTLLTLLIMLPLRSKSVFFGPRLRKKSGVKFLYLVIFLVLIYQAYSFLANRGILGTFEYNRIQLLNSALGPLAGRSEFLFSVPIFLDRPLIGFGSTNNIPNELVTQLAFNASKYIEISLFSEVPIHSFMMETVILVGILGMGFWITYLLFTFSNLKLLSFQVRDIQDPIVFLTIWTTWGIFFSPINSNERLILGLLTVLILKYQKTLNTSPQLKIASRS
jgi:hypothetical protein